MKSHPQNQLIFWEGSPPDAMTRRAWVDPNNPHCPFSKFIGNERAIKRLGRACFAAMGRQNHNMSDFSFAIIGPASTGKTTLVRLTAERVLLPFIELQPQTLNRLHDIFEETKDVCKKSGLELVQDHLGWFMFPPSIIFIDEVHNLKKNIIQGLLKAVERNDRQLVTESGVSVDTSLVCWMVATTDRGDLFDAFDTRFQKISLRLYSKPEMAKIIQLQNLDWDIDVCSVVARFCSHVPREALAFAQDMRIERQMRPGHWEDVALRVAADHGIDEFGMTFQRLGILKALGRRPISASQLTNVAQVKEEELRKFIMPPLLARTPDQEVPLVTVSSRGYTITPSGLAQLDIRGIPHNGLDAMPENIRETFETSMGVGTERILPPSRRF